MSSKSSRHPHRTGIPGRKHRNWLWLGAIVSIAALLAFLWSPGSGGSTPSTITPPAADSGSTAAPASPTNPAPAPAVVVDADVMKLRGRWRRPDGGYVIEIKDIAADGKAAAGYFNPRSIHVESATARKDNGTVKYEMVLQDVNYPGARYILLHHPSSDQLVGTYTQPAVGQTFDVVFVRQ